MLNVFNSVFTDIATPVRAATPGVFLTGERIAAPTKFPCVTVVEADNYEDTQYRNNTLTEQITSLMYEITVYSNLTSGKRSQCIEILQIIDDVMKRKNGTRIARVEGYLDAEAKIYMVTARYRMKTDGVNWYTF